MPAKKQPRKTYGRRASGKTQTTISLSDEMLEKAKRNAEADGRSLSNYIEQLLKSLPLLLILALAAMHWHRSPRNWSPAAIQKTAAAAWAKLSR